MACLYVVGRFGTMVEDAPLLLIKPDDTEVYRRQASFRLRSSSAHLNTRKEPWTTVAMGGDGLDLDVRVRTRGPQLYKNIPSSPVSRQ